MIAEIQINVPGMLSAKYSQGHKLYEVERDLPEGNETRLSVEAVERELYADAAAFDIAQAGGPETKSPERGSASRGSKAGSSPGMSPENTNTLPSGKRTQSSPLDETTNAQPSGKDLGTGNLFSDISGTSQDSVANPGLYGYSDYVNRVRVARVQTTTEDLVLAALKEKKPALHQRLEALGELKAFVQERADEVADRSISLTQKQRIGEKWDSLGPMECAARMKVAHSRNLKTAIAEMLDCSAEDD